MFIDLIHMKHAAPLEVNCVVIPGNLSNTVGCITNAEVESVLCDYDNGAIVETCKWLNCKTKIMCVN